ncbi:MAG: hypothetical protein SGJ27_22720 [Candidatus Melainabacteria bacterium]|nr:hypothetical protein [Candidatus Melainabacteria bacterium]
MAKIEQGSPRPVDDCYRILVLDVKSNHLDEIKEACKAVGQEVVGVTSIAEGLTFLNTKDHVDVVIAEAFLQNESVFDFLAKLKMKPMHADVPVMLIADEPSQVGTLCLPSVEVTAKLMGAGKFLFMPEFDIKRLMREIEAMLPTERLPKREADPTNAY